MNGSLISVIVPVYKVEGYLDECVQSLVGQTYSNLEIILVDDGSPDQCPDMCDEWGRRDSRIRAVHQENAGLSSARNAGLEVARGDYVSFVDSDDFLDAKMYEKLYEGITRSSHVGISAVKFYQYEDGVVSVYNPAWDSQEDVLVKADEFGVLTLQQKICHAVTNKLFRRILVENIRFRVGRLNEDVLFMHDISLKVREFRLDMWDLAYYAYYYRVRPGSIMHSDTPIDIAIIDNLQTIVEESPDPACQAVATRLYRQRIYSFCAQLLSCREPYCRLRKTYFDAYRSRLFSFGFSDINEEPFSFHSAVVFYLVKYMPRVYMFTKSLL